MSKKSKITPQNEQYINRNVQSIKKSIKAQNAAEAKKSSSKNPMQSEKPVTERTRVFKPVKPEDFINMPHSGNSETETAKSKKPKKVKPIPVTIPEPEAETPEQVTKKHGLRMWIFAILAIALVAALSCAGVLYTKYSSEGNFSFANIFDDIIGDNSDKNTNSSETNAALEVQTSESNTVQTTLPPETQPTIVTTTTTNFLDSIDLTANIDSAKKLDVEPVLQRPELPTGCEITSLTMVLNFWGYDVSKTDMADKYLPKTSEEYGKIDFNDYFGGTPYDSNAFGCFAPVIKKTADNYFATVSNPMHAADVSGKSLDDLYHYIDLGYPVVVWSTIGCYEADWKYYWTLDNGEEVDFPSLEHCVVLTGYDENKDLTYVNDPIRGATSYSKETFEKIYNEMRKMAVLIY